MTPLDCRWPGMLSCHHLCTPTGFPSYSWINLSRSILLFSLDPPSNCPKSWEASSFPMMALWPGVALNSSSNKGMSSLASTCNLTGWAQPWWKEGRRLSCPRIRNRFMLSALILQLWIDPSKKLHLVIYSLVASHWSGLGRSPPREFQAPYLACELKLPHLLFGSALQLV